MKVPSPGRVALALLVVAISALVDGPTGFVVGVGVVLTLAVSGRPRALILTAGALFVLTPLSMLRQGLVTPEELSLQLVSRYTMTNNLAFAGFSYLVVGVVLDVHRRTVEPVPTAPVPIGPDPDEDLDLDLDLDLDPDLGLDIEPDLDLDPGLDIDPGLEVEVEPDPEVAPPTDDEHGADRDDLTPTVRTGDDLPPDPMARGFAVLERVLAEGASIPLPPEPDPDPDPDEHEDDDEEDVDRS